MDREQINAFEAQLRRRLEEIDKERQLNAEARQTVTLDQASVGRVSRIDALQGQQMALAQDRNREAEVHQIAAALQRIADGSYGFCVVCDDKVAIKRLQFNPAVATCIDCAK